MPHRRAVIFFRDRSVVPTTVRVGRSFLPGVNKVSENVVSSLRRAAAQETKHAPVPNLQNHSP